MLTGPVPVLLWGGTGASPHDFVGLLGLIGTPGPPSCLACWPGWPVRRPEQRQGHAD
jgi:hypothetical protein